MRILLKNIFIIILYKYIMNQVNLDFNHEGLKRNINELLNQYEYVDKFHKQNGEIGEAVHSRNLRKIYNKITDILDNNYKQHPKNIEKYKKQMNEIPINKTFDTNKETDEERDKETDALSTKVLERLGKIDEFRFRLYPDTLNYIWSTFDNSFMPKKDYIKLILSYDDYTFQRFFAHYIQEFNDKKYMGKPIEQEQQLKDAIKKRIYGFVGFNVAEELYNYIWKEISGTIELKELVKYNDNALKEFFDNYNRKYMEIYHPYYNSGFN